MQLISVKETYNLANKILSNRKVKIILQALAILGLAGLATHAFASDDLLDGTSTKLIATLKGTGQKYLYIAECLVSLVAYIQTKNIMVLVGIIVVAVFFNVMLSMTGIS